MASGLQFLETEKSKTTFVQRLLRRLELKSWRSDIGGSVKERTSVEVLNSCKLLRGSAAMHLMTENTYMVEILVFFDTYLLPYYGMTCDVYIAYFSLFEIAVKHFDAENPAQVVYGDDSSNQLRVQNSTQY